jgi:hypothetical protein
MRWLLLLMIVGCSTTVPEEPAPAPTRILMEPESTPPPRIPKPVVTPDILMRDPPPAQEFDPEPLGDLSKLLPGRWQLVPDARKQRELQRAQDFLLQHPDRPEAANVVAALETVMAMELRVHKGTLRFSMPAAQAAHPYKVLRDDDPDLDIELQGPNGKKEPIHFVFEARDRITLERGRDHLTFERL